MGNNLLILGAKGTAKVTIDILEHFNKVNKIALLDNYVNEENIFGYPIIGKCDDLEDFRKNFSHAVVAISDCQIRMRFIARLLAAGYELPIIIHPTAFVSKRAKIGAGTLIFTNSVIQSSSELGIGCLVNSGAVVEHDNSLGNGVHMAPKSATTGNVTIRDKAFIAVGASIINKVTIGENSVVAAGSAVISDVPANVMVAGVPAKIKKHYSAPYQYWISPND